MTNLAMLVLMVALVEVLTNTLVKDSLVLMISLVSSSEEAGALAVILLDVRPMRLVKETISNIHSILSSRKPSSGRKKPFATNGKKHVIPVKGREPKAAQEKKPVRNVTVKGSFNKSEIHHLDKWLPKQPVQTVRELVKLLLRNVLLVAEVAGKRRIIQ